MNRKLLIQQFYKENKLNYSVVFFLTLFVGGLNLVVSWLLQQIMDTISGTPQAMELRILVLMAIGVLVILIFVSVLEYVTKPRFMKKAVQQYKEFAFRHLMKKNIHSFQKETTATYISAFSNDVKTVEENYLEAQFQLISAIVLFAGAFVMMLLYSPMLTLAVIILTIFPLLVSLLVGNSMEKAELQVSRENTSFTDIIKESILGFSVVKSFKAEKAITELFQHNNEQLEKAKCRKRQLSSLVSSISGAAGFVAQVGVFVIGAYFALSGKGVTPGVVLVFVQLMNYILQPIAVIPQLLGNRKAALALVDKLCANLMSNIEDTRTNTLSGLQKGIELQDVCFSYKEEENVLHHINLMFEAGKSYALVGASGSGKTTLLNLLLAGCHQYSGNIMYDGQELRNVNSDSLYETVSVIQQNVIIFNASVRDNITMFSDIPKAEVDRVIELSGLSEFMKQHGEDYLCGENGSALSGGEKQRISIARSLLKNSSVLLMDEATAALDKQTAYQVSNSILELEDMTRIVITHSLEEELLKRYDEIIVLKSGKVIEKGNFAGLMEKKEYFYSLYTVAQ